MTTAYALIRTIHLLACLLALGVCAFDRWIAGPIIRRGRANIGWNAMARGLVLGCLLLALLSGACWLVMAACTMSDLPPGEAMHSGAVSVVWNGTHFGRLWRLRLLLWAVTAACSVPAFFVAMRPLVRSAFVWATLLAAACLSGSLAWAGHGQTGPRPSLHLPVDVIHLLVCGLWPLGLIPFVLLLHRIGRVSLPLRWSLAARLTRRFSAASLICVGVLALTGSINSWLLVGSFNRLLDTGYGQTLLIKIACFFAMLALGAVNLLRLKPQLQIDALIDALEGLHETNDLAAARIKRNVVWEIILAAAVMIAVGLLGILPPAIEALHHHSH